ncbi:MAG: hypothetical protein DIU78_005210 [Pseudomonadota bacterium]|nr:MAG: hypothetical protein DIU78_00525 [Pseudomonadota bacterium]
MSDGKADPNYTLVVIADDGKVYKLTREVWENKDYLMKSDGPEAAAGLGIINQLKEFGSYLTFIPPDLAVGIGQICTVVNLQAILKNNVAPKASGDTNK